MYGCESWIVKKAEHWRIDAFELRCLRRLLRVPWTARRSNQSILNEISPEYSLEDCCWSCNSNILATWCEELTHLKRPWCWERFKVGREKPNRGWDCWMASPTQWTWVWVSLGVGDGQGILGCCSPWGCRVGYDWAIELKIWFTIQIALLHTVSAMHDMLGHCLLTCSSAVIEESSYGADRSLGYEPIHGGPKGTFMKLDWRILKKIQVCGRFCSSMKKIGKMKMMEN